MKVRIILISLIVILVVLFGVWYLIGNSSLNKNSQVLNSKTNSIVQQNSAPDSTGEIAKDLNSLPSDSGADSQFNILNQSLRNF